MPVSRRQLLYGGLALSTFSSFARAEGYPARPVRVIVPVGTGGQNDTTTRLVAQKLSETLGQQFYVENQAGAGGNLGMGAAARSAPDGYTILAAGGNFVINPGLYAKLPYDPIKDFAPVSMLCASPHVLAVHPSIPATTMRELIELIKAHPNTYNYASAGTGTPSHLAGELFKLTFGLDLAHVPYTSGGTAMVSTLGGHTHMIISSVPSAVTYVRANNVRALAVMSAKRSAAMPDVPTMAEASGADLQADIVTGFLVRTGTPPEIVDLLHREIAKAMAIPEVRERMAALGFESVANTPAEFGEWIKAEMAKWAKVIRDANIRPQ